MKRRRMIIVPVLLAALVSVIVAGIAGCGGSTVTVATTKWTADSGLLENLIPEFEKAYGVKVKIVTGETNADVAALCEQGKADVALMTRGKAEEAFKSSGAAGEPKAVMFRELIVVGPSADPAKIRGFDCPGKSSKAISVAGATYISRADGSDINMKELGYWEKCGANPEGQAWYIKTGEDMLGALQVASDMSGYVICDKLTWLEHQGSYNLEKLVEGCAMLFDQYDVITVNADAQPNSKINTQGAQNFSDFLIGQQGQEAIGAFTLFDTVIFRPNAD